MMDSHRLLLNTLMVMMACWLAVTSARIDDDALAVEGVEMGEVPLTDDLYSSDNGKQSSAKRTNQEDISKLLLKHLRFRQLPEPASSSSHSAFTHHARRPGHQEKRHEQRMLVNNLAALLSGLRDRQVESSMRMPSLRFGK